MKLYVFSMMFFQKIPLLAIIVLLMNSKQPASQVGSGRVTKKNNNYTASQKTEPDQKVGEQPKKTIITEPYQIVM